jgi:hypothetical protein
MKAYLHMPLLIASWFICNDMKAQTALAPDQNPNFAISRDKYMKMADSVNAWHSTTIQDTYKAIDWIADRQEARAERREFRRQNRRYWSGWYEPYYNSYNYGYRNYPYNNYNYGYRSHYHRHYYRGHRSSVNIWWSPWWF